jgi:hypothetical protein
LKTPLFKSRTTHSQALCNIKMAITDLDKIDNISIGSDNKCYLTISDQLDWMDESEHLNYLQEKLNVYVGFVKSGQLASEYSKLDLVIQVVAEYEVPIEIYNAAENQISISLKEDGLDFEWSELTK